MPSKSQTKSSQRLSSVLALLVAIAIPQLAGVIGSVFTVSAISGWYTGLVRPELAPPNWIFGPVWTSLFLLMGVAAFLVWRAGVTRKAVKVALVLFLGQLVLNILWSILFFGFQDPAAALIEIVVLWFAILVTIVAFAKVSKPAAGLLLPYLLWVSFATYLNYAFWMLN